MNRYLPHICRKIKLSVEAMKQAIEMTGGPGGTRTPNQAVMSAGINVIRLYISITCNILLALKSVILRLFLPQSAAPFCGENLND